jgi:hypothetical protein
MHALTGIIAALVRTYIRIFGTATATATVPMHTGMMFGDKLLIIRLGSFIDGTAGGVGNVDTRMVEDESYADYLGNRFGKRLFYFAVRDIKAGELIQHQYSWTEGCGRWHVDQGKSFSIFDALQRLRQGQALPRKCSLCGHRGS